MSKELELKAQLEVALLELSKLTGKSVTDWRIKLASKAKHTGLKEQIQYELKQNSLDNLEIGRSLSNSITFQGKTQSREAWAAEMGMSVSTLKTRLNRLGWSIEDTLLTPVREKKKHK